MAESLPPESDNRNPSADEEEIVQIGAHSTVFPPPEEAPAMQGSAAGATAVVGATAVAQTTGHDEMDADQTTKTPAVPPAEGTTASQSDSVEPKSTKRESCMFGCLHDVLLVLISALLGGALVLGVLLFLNGTLDMRGHDAVIALNSYQETLSDNLSTLNGRVNAHEESLNALDQNLSDTNRQLDAVDEHGQALDSQVEDLDDQMQTLGSEMQTLDASVQTLGVQVQDLDQRTQTMDIKITIVREEVVVLNREVAKLSVRSDNTEAEIADINQQMAGINLAAERFDTFAEGLQALAESLSKPDSASPEPESSNSEPISNTEPITVSITITTTETITAAEPITPTVSLPLVGNRVDADAGNTEEDASVPPTTDNIPSLTLFPPLEALPDLTAGQSHIFGLVWDDLNGNGQPEEGEIPIPSVSIILRDARGNVVATTVTDGAGRYLFADVAPGVYIVEETDPADAISILSNLITVTAPAGSMVETNFADQF